MQMVRKYDAILSDSYKQLDMGVGVADITGKATTWTCGQQLFEEKMRQTGFVWVKANGLYLSCYAFSSITKGDFERLVIAGDFSAYAIEWGSRNTNTRGSTLLEAFSSLDIE